MTNRDDRDTAEYWDRLARRVVAAAQRQARLGPLDWLSQSAPGWLSASLLIVAALVFLFAGGGSYTSGATNWSDALAPTNTVGRAIALSDDAPAIGTLLFDRLTRSDR